jgi:SRSO17 transposase
MGVLVIDDTGDRKAGRHTAHVGRQYLGSVGKLDNGIVAVASLWADERVYYPLHVAPSTPARRLPRGAADPAFRTKPQLAAHLVAAAGAAGVPFRRWWRTASTATAWPSRRGLWAAGLPFVLALKPKEGRWAPMDDAHTPVEAAQAVP